MGGDACVVLGRMEWMQVSWRNGEPGWRKRLGEARTRAAQAFV